MFASIIIVAIIGKPEPEAETTSTQPTPVSIYTIGKTARLTVQGKVEKIGVTTIIAQQAGVVSKVNVKEGQTVGKGTTLLTLSTNYQGASVPAMQLALANAQLKFQEETLTTQKELIGKQREIAEKTNENSEEMRQISSDSLDNTREQLDLTNDILKSLDENLKTLEGSTATGASSLVLSTKQLKAQFLGVRNQLETAIQTTEYQTDEDKAAATLPDLTKEMTLKQLEIQEKTIELNHEMAKINRSIAAISASLMAPASPGPGTIERVHVRPGQLVNPGTPLVTISGVTNTAQVVVALPPSTAQKVSRLETADTVLNNQTFALPITHISSGAIQNQSGVVIVSVPNEALAYLNDGQYLTVTLPVGYPDSVGVLPNIPIDTVHQTQEGAFVMVVGEGSVAKSKPVMLGQIMGDRAEVTDGLVVGDQIITSRSVSEDEAVTVTQ